jgi:hypothetical protein
VLITDLTMKGGRLVEKTRRVRAYQSCEYNGSVYDSRAEADYAMELDIRQRSGEIRTIERQVSLPLDVAGIHIATHRVDFRVTFADGTIELHEVKGFESREWAMKRNLTRALFPAWRYVTVDAKGKRPKSSRRLPSRKLRSRQVVK